MVVKNSDHPKVPAATMGRSALASLLAVALLGCGQPSADKLMASAKEHLAKGERGAAVIELKNLLQTTPDDPEARYLLGKASLEQRDYLTAEKELRRALALKQPESEVLPLLAKAMTELGQNEELVKEFGGRTLQGEEAQATFQSSLGDAYLALGDRAAAESAYTAALSAKGDYPSARLGRASMLALDGKIDEALAEIDEILTRSPKFANAHYLRARLMLTKGDESAARAAFQAAIEADPEFLPARLALVGFLIDQGDFDEAAKQLEGARKAAPRDLRVINLSAMLAYQKKDVEGARQQVQQVLKAAPESVPALMLAGALALSDRQYAAAESNLSKALFLAPANATARHLLAQTYLRLGQPTKARNTLQPLLTADALQNQALLLLAGEVFLANGDMKTASAFFNSASQFKSAQAAAARTRMGQIAFATGKAEEGFRQLQAAADLDSGQYQADLALIAGHVQRDELDRATAAVQALEKKQPNNPLTFQLYGALDLLKKDRAAARRSFQRALELQPGYLPAAIALAQIDLAEKKPEEAVKRFEGMIARDPKNDELYLALADLQARTGADSKVYGETLRRAVDADPRSVTARVALISFLLANDDAKAALTAARNALAALPNDPRILHAASVAQEASGEFDQAIDSQRKLAALQPGSTAPWLRLAALYARQKEPDKAADALKRAQKLSSTPRELVPQLVQAYMAAGRPDDALKEVRELRRLEPKLVAAYALEGDIYVQQRKFADAERMYREALRLEPAAAGGAIRLHQVLLANGKGAEADAFGKKWIAEHPKNAAMRMYLADRDLATKNLKAAASQYQAVLAIEPNNVVALTNLAWIGGETGDSKALGYAERAVKLAPGNAIVLDTYGGLLVKKGDFKNGVEQLARAAKLAPVRYDIRLKYAKALAEAGQKEQARKELEALQAVPEDFPGKSDIPSILKKI